MHKADPASYPERLEELRRVLLGSRRAVFFGGAGVSTESGIPDFRSVDGLYHQKFAYPPEEILSHHFFLTHPEEFFRFYREKMLPQGVLPNAAHLRLAQLEKAGILQVVITQNIDGLHTDAGSRTVLELHGSTRRNRCMRCGRAYGLETVAGCAGVPYCSCGGIVKPDVVLYEEALDEDVLRTAVHCIAGADTLIVAGTSLTVYPAAGLVQYFRGDTLVLINRDETPMDTYATLLFREKVGQVLGDVGAVPAADE